MKRKSLIFAIFTAGSIFFTACNKDKTLSSATGLETAEDQSALENEFTNVDRVIEGEDAMVELQGGRLDSFPHPDLPPCATATWHGDSLHRVLVIDYGDVPCLCPDGRYRKGKVITEFEGPRHEIRSSKTITMDHLWVDGHVFMGRKICTYMGDATFDRHIREAVMFYDGDSSRWEADEKMTVLQGFDTPDPRDDVRKIIGTGHGINRNGVGYRSRIVEPLIRIMDPGCAFTFVDGQVETSDDNGKVRLLDYDPIGGAPCDRIGSITIDGETHMIELH